MPTTVNLLHSQRKRPDMDSFLKIVADDLYEKLHGHLERLTIVFPNKRASLFFLQSLHERLREKPMWAPQFTTLDDLFAERSALTLADPLLLVCKLHQCFLQASQRTLTLDKFYSWGNMMINDFDDIDNNLIDAEKLFQNLSDLDALTDFSFLSEDQVKAIQRLFSSFDPNDLSTLKKHFLQFWNILLPVYHDFQAALRHERLAYRGMLRRDVIDALPRQTLKETRTYAFVGFNVLSQTERKLCEYFREHADTFFYWDYDIAYLNDHQSEAARFIRQDIAHFGSALPDSHPCYDNLSRLASIDCISSSTEEAQAHFAAEWLRNVAPTAPWTDTAVVLADESLLTSLTHTLPSEMPVNVTMGFPLQQTVVAGWVRMLLDLQRQGFSSARRLRGNVAMQVLRHPYTARLGGQERDQLLCQLERQPQPYPTTDTLGRNDFLREVFSPQRDNESLLTWLLHLLNQLGVSYSNATPFGREGLAAESVFSAYTLASRLHELTQTGLLDVQPETLMRLLLQLIADRAIPFHGEPAEGVQVMGMLETRNLDFRHVLLLSASEGNLPRNERQPSFIPYNLREAYGLTTVEQRTSLSAYYFYRLLQRAEHATVVYNATADGQHSGEPSRFVSQILLDASPTLHLPIRRKTLVTPNEPSAPRTLIVPKNAEMVQKLRDRGLLSPSALNVYIDCPLHFYYQYIEGLRAADDMDEEVGSDVFGTIFHNVMEKIYSRIFPLGQPIAAEQLLALAANAKLLTNLVDQHFATDYFHTDPSRTTQLRFNGDQRLKREVIIRLVRTQLRYDATICPLTILATEYPCHGSRIDRIDRATVNGHEQLRVVDYKTSTSPQTPPAEIERLFDTNQFNRAYHVFQIFYYALLLTDADIPQDTPTVEKSTAEEAHEKLPFIDFHAEPLAPALMYTACSFKGGTAGEALLKMNRQPITDFSKQLSEEFRERIHRLLEEIYDSSIPFGQTPNTQHCTYCPFIDICRRALPTD